jgi:hypothetical protein
MTRHAAKIVLSGELLSKMLGLKEGVTVRAASTDLNRNCMEFLIEGEGLPEVAEGGLPPQVDPLTVMEDPSAAPKEPIIVDENEMAKYIVEKMKAQGANVDLEAIRAVLDLEYHYMQSIGLINGQ